jgi:hypothetical protein
MFTIRLPRVILIFEYPQYNSAKTAGTASAISLADVKTNDATSFFMCGVGNSTAASDCDHDHNVREPKVEVVCQIKTELCYSLCELCGHGNPWVN